MPKRAQAQYQMDNGAFVGMTLSSISRQIGHLSRGMPFDVSVTVEQGDIVIRMEKRIGPNRDTVYFAEFTIIGTEVAAFFASERKVERMMRGLFSDLSTSLLDAQN